MMVLVLCIYLMLWQKNIGVPQKKPVGSTFFHLAPVLSILAVRSNAATMSLSQDYKKR